MVVSLYYYVCYICLLTLLLLKNREKIAVCIHHWDLKKHNHRIACSVENAYKSLECLLRAHFESLWWLHHCHPISTQLLLFQFTASSHHLSDHLSCFYLVPPLFMHAVAVILLVIIIHKGSDSLEFLSDVWMTPNFIIVNTLKLWPTWPLPQWYHT